MEDIDLRGATELNAEISANAQLKTELEHSLKTRNLEINRLYRRALATGSLALALAAEYCTVLEYNGAPQQEASWRPDDARQVHQQLLNNLNC